MISKEWVQPVDAVHKLFKTSSDIKDQEGNVLVTAYTVKRPDGKWAVMLVNKDRDHDHDVKVTFADATNGQSRYFVGRVDRIVFGPAEYQWHSDLGSQAAILSEDDRPRRITGHADPDGPPSKSIIQSHGADTTYSLPKASVIVLRGISNRYRNDLRLLVPQATHTATTYVNTARYSPRLVRLVSATCAGFLIDRALPSAAMRSRCHSCRPMRLIGIRNARNYKQVV